ncbi:MAG: MBL fold metallo-hydrolase [Christensenellaceae bacterium]|jgi:beta-lactamase superfamily II metal-dependent hydrolase|nr:MBL fold metallo-hydrolase [Christensenellaceae bacterium]
MKIKRFLLVLFVTMLSFSSLLLYSCDGLSAALYDLSDIFGIESDEDDSDTDISSPDQTTNTKPSVPVSSLDAEKIGFEIHFINVGQGDAIVIRLLRENINIIVDAGSGTGSGNATIAASLVDYISALGITTFQYAFATHVDSDHINFFDDIYKNFTIGQIFLNDIPDTHKSNTATVETLRQSAVDGGSIITDLEANKDFAYDLSSDDGTYTFEFFAPGYNMGTDDNDMSPMILFGYAGRRVLLTGDATIKTEKWFLRFFGEEDFDVDVLKVGHHGSNTSTSQEFLDVVRPEYGIISVKEGTYNNLPSWQVLERLESNNVTVYRTDLSGTIVLYVTSDGDMAFATEK